MTYPFIAASRVHNLGRAPRGLPQANPCALQAGHFRLRLHGLTCHCQNWAPPDTEPELGTLGRDELGMC